MIETFKKKGIYMSAGILSINALILIYFIINSVINKQINFGIVINIIELITSIWFTFSLLKKVNNKTLNKSIITFITIILIHFLYSLSLILIDSNGSLNKPDIYLNLFYNTSIILLYSYNLYIHIMKNKVASINIPITVIIVTSTYLLLNTFLFNNKINFILSFKTFLPSLALLLVTLSNKSNSYKISLNKTLTTTILFILVGLIGFITNVLPIITSNLNYDSFSFKFTIILISILPIIIGYSIIIYFLGRKQYKWFDKKLFSIESIITTIVQLIFLIGIL